MRQTSTTTSVTNLMVVPISPMIPVRANFLNDLRETYSEQLQNIGLKLPKTADVEAVCLMMANMSRRLIQPAPRNVLRSNELRERALNTDQRAALDAIESLSQVGENLNPYLHTRLMKPGYNDLLLNDWGIHHMHLGLGKRQDGFVDRSEEVLFVHVTPAALLFIDVRPHGEEKYPLWTCESALVDIIHKNWPEAIAQHKSPGVVSAPHLSDGQRKNLRDRRMNALVVTSDGTAYYPPGGGLMSSGANLRDRMFADWIMTRAVELQRACEQKRAQLQQAIFDQTGQLLSELHLRLVLHDGQIKHIEERQTRVMIPV